MLIKIVLIIEIFPDYQRVSEEDVITGFRCNQQFELIKFPTKCQDVIIDRGYEG